MAKTNIPLSDNNIKFIKNFIGMCRMNGLEGPATPSFTFKEYRENLDGNVIFDIYYQMNTITEPCWNMTVKIDTSVRFHDGVASKPGETYCYLDSYRIDHGSLELITKTSKFNVFAF
ncbi:MAG: hypothetical protein Q4E53_13365 [Eubacteriales bacterium]|nr:hypothetical protein [Eubacteriales bacterium]